MNKKGQGLSMNVIIIAAISLLVLVIISVLVLRSANRINEGTGCTGSSGYCIDIEDACNAENVEAVGGPAGMTWIHDRTNGCGDDNLKCCIPL